MLFFVLNTILTVASSIAGCANPDSLITPQRYRLIIFTLLSLIFIVVGSINATIFRRIGVASHITRKVHFFTFFGVLMNLLRASWNLIVQFPVVRSVKETSLHYNTLAWPFMYVALLVSTEVIPIFCYTGLLLMISRSEQENANDTRR